MPGVIYSPLQGRYLTAVVRAGIQPGNSRLEGSSTPAPNRAPEARETGEETRLSLTVGLVGFVTSLLPGTATPICVE